MRRLYVHILLTVAAALALFALLAGVVWRSFGEQQWHSDRAAVAELLSAALPAPDSPPPAQQAALEKLAGKFKFDVSLYDADGKPLARIGAEVPAPEPARDGGGWVGDRGPPAWSLKLPDGRWVVTRPQRGRRGGPFPGIFTTLALLALAVAVGTYPVVRRLTRRLERLRSGVDALGAGNLGARVAVEGRDEVASLAASFNRSAGRIEALVGAHKTLLANASHELRSPLARIRMAVEMLEREPRAEHRDEIRRDIAELDSLIDEILLASRLDTLEGLERREPVDLLALAAEDCARTAATLEGEHAVIEGDPRLLRRLLRNLLENARRHGGGTQVDVRVRSSDSGVEISVCDRGPGVPEAERERIFEPFYRQGGLREREGGVGLGLSLVRSIAHRHAGSVVCEAREGGGSCFCAHLGLHTMKEAAKALR